MSYCLRNAYLIKSVSVVQQDSKPTFDQKFVQMRKVRRVSVGVSLTAAAAATSIPMFPSVATVVGAAATVTFVSAFFRK